MTDIPIIFSGPMVRALLDGRKTMTRRLLYTLRKTSKHSKGGSMMKVVKDGREIALWPPMVPDPMGGKHYDLSGWQNVKPGDRLWVRESLTHVTSDPVTAEDCSVHCYSASIPPGMDSANPYEPNYLFPTDGEPNLKPKSVPSIHMPRWASRLTLVVTATKIERLQDIDHDDALQEGASDDHGPGTMFGFISIWKRLHGPDSWSSNPEVVCLSFRVLKQNIDAPEAMAA